MAKNQFEVNNIIAYENGEMTQDKEVKFFADGIKSKQVYQLQGHYGRTANAYVETGLITKDGKITSEGKKYIKNNKGVYNN